MSNWPPKNDNALSGRGMAIENENYVEQDPRSSSSATRSLSMEKKQKTPTVPVQSDYKTSATSANNSANTLPPPTIGPFKISLSPSSIGSGAGPNTSPFRASPIRAAANQVPLAPVNTPKQFSRFEKTQQQVEEVADVMRGNLENVLERGEKFGDLDHRAEHLEETSKKFATTTKKLKTTYWWKNTKCTICIILAVFVLLCIVGLFAYLFIHPK